MAHQNTPISGVQVSAMVLLLNDYLVKPALLSEDDTRLELFIDKHTPHKIIDLAYAMAHKHDMHTNILDSYTMPDYILFTTWRYDYRPNALVW